MTRDEQIRAHYTTISVVRNFINHAETIIELAKEQIAVLEGHANVRVQETAPDARVEQLKLLAQMLGVKSDEKNYF